MIVSRAQPNQIGKLVLLLCNVNSSIRERKQFMLNALKTFSLKYLWFILIISLLWVTASCGNKGVTESSTSQPTNGGASNQTNTYTATFTTTIQSATPSPSLEYSTKFPVIVSITPSSVPLGIFSLLFYRPLVMVYDVTQWEDITPYNQPNAIAKNYLQSKKKSSCKIGVQGPINFNDPSQYKSEEAHLGNINYEVKIFSNNPDRSITTFYIDDKSIKGFNYENAFPVLSVQSDENEWKDCRRFAETILSTLSLP